MDWKDFPPRTVNRGGTPDPTEVVGREEMVMQMWRALEKQSVLLTAERRLGKTCILLLMENSPAEGTLVFRRDLEDVRTPTEFVERILQDIHAYLSLKRRGGELWQKIRKAVGGIEIGGKVKLPEANSQPWKTLLERIISDLVSNQEQRVVFLWDELPLMLDNIVKQAGEPAAMEVLDTLRALRQQHPARLRMVYTGSVGLHHVLGALRRANYGNAPTNDMLPRDLAPLDLNCAQGLAWSLLCGENLPTVEPEMIVKRIAESVNGLPFYIQHVVGRLADTGGEVTQERVDAAVSDLLSDPNDSWETRNYQTRIRKHYLPEHVPFALGLLDALAVMPAAMQFRELFNQLKHRMETEDEETVREVLDLLQRDHYILHQSEQGFIFRFSIVARAWRTRRGL
jgi:hypothetical protein